MQGKEQHVGFSWHILQCTNSLFLHSSFMQYVGDELFFTTTTILAPLLGLEIAMWTGDMQNAADAQLRNRRPTHR
jgi:hypothetical protein